MIEPAKSRQASASDPAAVSLTGVGEGSRGAGLHVRGLRGAQGAFELSPVSLDVPPGGTLWVAGPNGVGKSTLLALLAGVLPTTGGRVELFGQDLTHTPAWERDIAWLIQDLGLWPHLTVRAQAKLVMPPGQDSGLIDDIADCLDITAMLDRKPSGLSGGEAQRCAILRTFAMQRTVLLLDEPFAAQHNAGSDRIEQLIARELARDRICLVAAHHPPDDQPTLRLPAGA